MCFWLWEWEMYRKSMLQEMMGCLFIMTITKILKAHGHEKSSVIKVCQTPV